MASTAARVPQPWGGSAGRGTWSPLRLHGSRAGAGAGGLLRRQIRERAMQRCGVI